MENVLIHVRIGSIFHNIKISVYYVKGYVESVKMLRIVHSVLMGICW